MAIAKSNTISHGHHNPRKLFLLLLTANDRIVKYPNTPHPRDGQRAGLATMAASAVVIRGPYRGPKRPTSNNMAIGGSDSAGGGRGHFTRQCGGYNVDEHHADRERWDRDTSCWAVWGS